MTFDPYQQWLDIPPSEQPPNHYRLLGITLFEADPAVISQAADRRAAQVKTVPTAQHADLSQRLLNEIAAAKQSLLDPGIKRNYDADLARRSPSPPLVAGPLAAAESQSPGRVGLTTASSRSRHGDRRHVSNLLWLALGGLALLMTISVAVLAMWLLNADSTNVVHHDSKPSSLADSRLATRPEAVVASGGSSSPSNGKSAVNSVVTPPKTSPATERPLPSHVVVVPPRPSVLPIQETRPPTKIKVEKKKGKKTGGKKAVASASTWKTTADGYPVIAGNWRDSAGRPIKLTQQKGQFTATGTHTDDHRDETRWRWSGTIGKDGHLSGQLVYTPAASGSAASGSRVQNRTAVLSADGKTIRGDSKSKVAGNDFPWKRKKRKPS
jgi:hypothetical protein